MGRFTLAPPELPSSTQLTKDIKFSLTPPSVVRPRHQSGQQKHTTLRTNEKLTTPGPKQTTPSPMLKSTLSHVRDDIQHEARKKTNGHSMSGHRNNRNRPLVIT